MNQFYNDIFFFRVPKNKLTITGLNSTLELASGKSSNFHSVYDQFNYWKKNYSTNWNGQNFGSIPIICCSAKFDSSKSTPLWNDFESLRIYIPEFIFSFQNGQATGVYNFILDEFYVNDRKSSSAKKGDEITFASPLLVRRNDKVYVIEKLN